MNDTKYHLKPSTITASIRSSPLMTFSASSSARLTSSGRMPSITGLIFRKLESLICGRTSSQNRWISSTHLCPVPLGHVFVSESPCYIREVPIESLKIEKVVVITHASVANHLSHAFPFFCHSSAPLRSNLLLLLLLLFLLIDVSRLVM